MPVIVGMMRVKNEARWIERVLQSMLPLCKRIFVFDDHSEDNTVQLCESFPEVELFNSPFIELNEARDKNWLLEKVEPSGADWVLSIDGDEEIYPGGQQIIQEITDLNYSPDTYRFRVLYLWNRPDRVRMDKIYGSFRRPSLFRLRPGARFVSANGGGFHCGNTPEAQWIADCDVNLLHYGYMLKVDRIKKYAWYNQQVPVPEIEDHYNHIIIGDLLPENAVTRWGGPLKLEHISSYLQRAR
jgi:glycosyltransferase involved in cell wall biosynthesis